MITYEHFDPSKTIVISCESWQRIHQEIMTARDVSGNYVLLNACEEHRLRSHCIKIADKHLVPGVAKEDERRPFVDRVTPSNVVTKSD